ncbi:MAG: peptidyl-prolyl cis-trans isomerase, EpsD family [Betaproteobacteria bacterium]|nr:peptidyl-prolyl cis-trans isomerase, EpsD family [Betaproteobacteria bacterium]
MNLACGKSVGSLLLVAVLAGCGSEEDKPASQTAAKVNDDEVTVHQINAELQRLAGNLPQGADTEAATKRILEGLIDQTLLVQQAVEAKLDRDPQVLQQLESSRRQILAQAYVDRQAAGSPATPEQIKEFYAKHPGLFEHRRVYAFREFVFERAKYSEQLREQLNAAKTPADVSKILNAAGIRYRERNSTRPAEALPIEALPRIAKMNKGDTAAFTDQNVANVLMLLDYAEQPVPMERATQAIQRYLFNQKRREVAQDSAKDLRAKAKIEYVGNYAKSDVDAVDAKSSPAPATQEQKADDHIEKGVAGLRR